MISAITAALSNCLESTNVAKHAPASLVHGHTGDCDAPLMRPATAEDLPRLIDLLIMDAARRRGVDRVLWAMAEDAAARIGTALSNALTTERQAVRQA